MCNCKCRLNASICTNKKSWNNHKRSCECKELIDKGVCNKGSIWNPSNCECKCDKSCDFGEYLDYENCKCRKKLVDKLVEECTENVEGVKLVKITPAENEHNRSSCALYVLLFSMIFTANIEIGSYFLYFQWHLKNVALCLYSNNNLMNL